MSKLAQVFTAILVALLVTTYSQNEVHAGGTCKQPTEVMLLNGMALGARVADRLNQAEEDLKKKGIDLKVAIIGRTGTDPKNIMPLRDFEGDRPLSLDEIVRISKQSYEQNSNFEPDGFEDWEIGLEIRDLFAQYDETIKFSHLGFAVKNHPKASDHPLGRWMVVHKLKPCKNRESTIFEQGLGLFFSDDPYDYGALIMVPSQDIQDHLYELLLPSKNPVKAYENIRYNVAALPFQTKELNSNQYPLEMLAAAQVPLRESLSWPTSKFRSNAQRILNQNIYIPSRVHYSGVLNALPLAQYALHFVDIRAQKYTQHNVGEVVTAASIRNYLYRNSLMEEEIRLRLLPIEVVIDDSPPEDDSNNWD